MKTNDVIADYKSKVEAGFPSEHAILMTMYDWMKELERQSDDKFLTQTRCKEITEQIEKNYKSYIKGEIGKFRDEIKPPLWRKIYKIWEFFKRFWLGILATLGAVAAIITNIETIQKYIGL